MFSSINFRKTP